MSKRLVTLIFLIFICTKFIESNVEFYSKSKISDVLNDLPMQKDLWGYFKALERIVEFRSLNENKLDLNGAFGLLVVNVNLRSCTRNKSLPQVLLNHLERILSKSYHILERFKLNEKQKKFSRPLGDTVSSLSEESWSKMLVKFNFDLLDAPVKCNTEYRPWNEYVNDVHGNLDAAVPNPKLSDKCINVVLSMNNTENMSQYYPRKCSPIPLECYFSQIFGTNFGYSLTHRLLFLQVAQTRECILFSTERDNHLRRKYCVLMYKEAEYIANNNFKINDLILEQIALCSLEGHAQFIRRSWIAELMRSQEASGSFKIRLPRLKGTGNIDRFDDHVTAVAGAVLASSIRFILEKYLY